MDFNPNIVRQSIGPYRLTRQLGRGSMGTVFRASDSRTGKTVAIKVLMAPSDPAAVKRFKNEVRIMSTLNHPNIVRALSTTIRRCGQQYYYFPMEYVDGSSLEQILQAKGALPLGVVIPIIRDVCNGLDYAHTRRVVHRDLKPGNILISGYYYPSARITDFGLAKAFLGGTGAETFAVIGARSYCSPNKWENSADVSPATDLFSLGVIMYRMLVGKLPFYAQSEGKLRNVITRGEYMRIATVKRGIPERIEHLVDRLLKSDSESGMGPTRVRDIMDAVYPKKESGLDVFPSWEKVAKSIRRMGKNPDYWLVLRTVNRHLGNLACPECHSALHFDTYMHINGEVVALIFNCRCQQREMEL